MAWMNGKRTVRCYNCYGVGHNKRSCPDLSPEKKEYYASGAGARSCSYCGEPKHNKKSCMKRKADITSYALNNAEYRKGVLDRMLDHGIGIGSLVCSSNACPDGNIETIKGEHLFMVTDIVWDKIQAKRKYGLNGAVLRTVSLTEDGWDPSFSLPFDNENYSRTIVVTKAKADAIIGSVPPDWLDGKSGTDGLF